ncbi:MAG TPA: hypothetical protein VI757_06675 [Bacteroidia bacterium]|nr:hypothetical protein [Bacteroidia bacterium]
MKSNKQSSIKNYPEHRMVVSRQNVLSEHDLLLIRETAKLTENLYVKMICDNLAMEKILRLM